MIVPSPVYYNEYDKKGVVSTLGLNPLDQLIETCHRVIATWDQLLDYLLPIVDLSIETPLCIQHLCQHILVSTAISISSRYLTYLAPAGNCCTRALLRASLRNISNKRGDNREPFGIPPFDPKLIASQGCLVSPVP